MTSLTCESDAPRPEVELTQNLSDAANRNLNC